MLTPADREALLNRAASITNQIRGEQARIENLAAERRGVVAALRAGGVTHREISDAMGVTEQICLKIMAEYRRLEAERAA